MHKKFLIGFFIFLIAYSSLGQRVPFRKGNLWGLSDLKGNIISQPKYDSVAFMYYHYKNLRAKTWKGKKTGLIDTAGKEILPPIYDQISDRDKLIIVKKNNKTGMFNYKGQNLLPIIYDEIETEQDDFLYLTQNHKKGLARYYNNKVVIKLKPQFDTIYYIFYNHIFECITNGKTQYLDTLCQPVKYKPENIDLITVAESTENEISMDEIQKLIDERENEKMKYKTRLTHNRDLVLKKDSALFEVIYERKNGFWGVRKCSGQILVPYMYDDIDLNTSNLQNFATYRQVYALKYRGKWGLIGHKNRSASNYKDTTTYPLIEFKYDSISCLSNCGFFCIEKSGKKGIIKANDFNKIIVPKYLYIRYSTHELNKEFIFWVQAANGKFGYINENGLEYFKDE